MQIDRMLIRTRYLGDIMTRDGTRGGSVIQYIYSISP